MSTETIPEVEENYADVWQEGEDVKAPEAKTIEKREAYNKSQADIEAQYAEAHKALEGSSK